MNLKSRKVRLPIAALGACALVTGGGVLAAGSAFAAGETVSFLGATGNAASIVAADPTTTGGRPLSYGVRLSGLPSTPGPITLQVLTAPSSSTLYAERVNGTGAPVADSTFSAIAGAGTLTTTAGSTAATFTVAPTTDFTNSLIKVGTEYYVGSSVGTAVTLTSPAQTSQSGVTVTSAGAAASNVVHVPATTATNPTLPAYAAGNNVYFGASTAGTYTFRVFSDNNSDGVYQANTDDATPTFTLTVKSAADAFSLTAPSTVTAGTKGSMAKITPTVDTSDIRGGSPSALGTALSNALAVDIADNGTASNATIATTAVTTGSPTITLAAAPSPAWAAGAIVLNAAGQTIGTVSSGGATTTVTLTANAAVAAAIGDVLHVGSGIGGENTGGLVTFTTADGLYRYISTDATTALTQGSGTPTSLTSVARFLGTAITGASKTTEVASNSVTALALAVKAGQTTNVLTSAGVAQVRAGTADVTYTATAKDTNGAVLAGKDVTFTLTGTNGTTASTDLKANGATVPTSGLVTVTTDSDGVATLKVTSTKTADTNAYSVAATSGVVNGTTITATYFATAPYLVTSSNVAALVGGSAVLSGKVVDRWGEPYSSSGLTAALAVSGGATPASGNYAIGADGKFTATVNDTTSNTTPRNDSFTWTVSGATTQAGTKTLAWRTSITPGSVSIDTTTVVGSSTDTAIPFTSSTTKVDIASSGAFSPGDVETIKGTLKDTAATPAALPYASVTYTGSDGVYFYDSDNKLSKTTTAVTTSAGKISYDGTTDGIRVLFTKTGDATITAKSGTVTKTVTVPVEASTDAYKVSATDVAGKPGTTITVQGKAVDAFGNPATGRFVTLALSSVSAGNFSGTDAVTGTAGYQVQTDDLGVWSTPFTSTSNQNGTVTLTATLWNAGNTAPLTANPTVNAAYATAGLTIGDGVYTTTSKIKIGATALTLQSSAKITYGSKYYARGALLSGTGADADADVDIYAKVPGGTYALIDTVKADAEGEFGVAEKISKSTYFLAKSGGSSSSASATRIYSGVVLTGKSFSKGHVTLSANGGPNAKAYLYFYRVMSSGDTSYLGKKLSTSSGNGSATYNAPKGNRKYKVLYKAPGTTTGSDTVSVKVK